MGEVCKDYYYIKIMLSYIFINKEDLLNINSIKCETWQEAFLYYKLLHYNYNNEFYDPIPALSNEVNNDSDNKYEFKEEEDKPIKLQNHKAFTRIRPRRDNTSRIITTNNLGSRDLNYEYN